ncbi:MAG: hypothetical protein GY765_43430, partial [bacterium]|nr:hypothetical protein [bacterium]
MVWNTGSQRIYLLRLQVLVFYLKLLDIYFGQQSSDDGEVYEKPDVSGNHVEPTEFKKTWNATYDKVDNLLSLVKTNSTIAPEISNVGDNEKLHQYSRFDDWTLNYDKNGNTTQKGSQKFYYNYRNQMVRAVENASTTAEYKYDAMGRRIEKTVGSDTTKYFYSGNQVIEERDSSDAILKQFIYGTGIDELLMTAVYTDGVATPYYMHTNRIGSITAVTDQDGNVVERISYEAFGKHTITDYKTDPENPTIVDNSVIGNEILFQGRRYDKE